jgi:AraC-like DNA-binding protein
MLENDKIVVKDILFVERSRDAKRGEHVFSMKAVYHHQLLYKLDGEAIITYNGKKVKEKKGDVRFLPSPSSLEGTPDYRAEVVELCECINIGFLSDSRLPLEISVKSCGNDLTLKMLFEKLHKCWYNKRDGYYHKCMSILYEILHELSACSLEYVSSGTYRLILPAVDHIDANFRELHFDYKILADMCGISYTYMSKIFVKHFGMSPNRYIMSKKIEYASDLLKTKNYSVNEVAKMSGFVNTYYFSRVFKAYTKLSPTEYNKASSLFRP